MGEIDDAAEREDQRQAERDQEVIDAVEQAVEDLLQLTSMVDTVRCSVLDRARLAEETMRSLPPRASPPALQAADARARSRVAIVQRSLPWWLRSLRASSFGPGTGGLELKMSHWFLILSAGSAVDRIHLVHHLVIGVAEVALARLEHVELRALLEVLDDLGRLGRLDLVDGLRHDLGRDVVAPGLVLRRLVVLSW